MTHTIRRHGSDPASTEDPSEPDKVAARTGEASSAGGSSTVNPRRLSDMREGHSAVIARITGGRRLRERMAGLGLHAGSRIRLVRAAPFSGPLLVEDPATGIRVMIGRSMASSVEVTDEAKA
jgi:Fe2+ transport system protein FeoA